MKPSSDACLRNQQPILEVLQRLLPLPVNVLEIGSGTGQHAIYMARHLPQVHWQPSDLPQYLGGIHAWVADAELNNLELPLELDVYRQPWPIHRDYQAIFSANTLHFMEWAGVEALLSGASQVLPERGQLILYGPFNENHRYTSPGNENLDIWLQGINPGFAIKDRAEVLELAQRHHLQATELISMPANNQMLVLQKSAAGTT